MVCHGIHYSGPLNKYHGFAYGLLYHSLSFFVQQKVITKP